MNVLYFAAGILISAGIFGAAVLHPEWSLSIAGGLGCLAFAAGWEFHK